MALLKVEPVMLEGRYVRLDPAHASHALAMSQIATMETFQYFVTGAPLSVDEDGMHDYIESKLADPNVLPFSVFSKDLGKYVGMTTYMDIRREHGGLEIGMTWYAPEVRGTKVNPE